MGTLPDLFDIDLADAGNFRQTVEDDLERVDGYTTQELEFHIYAALGAGWKGIGAQQRDFVRQSMFGMYHAVYAALRHNLPGLETFAIQDFLLLWIYIFPVYEMNPTISKRGSWHHAGPAGSGIGQMTDTTSLTLCDA
jgi:hypothetical protein